MWGKSSAGQFLLRRNRFAFSRKERSEPWLSNASTPTLRQGQQIPNSPSLPEHSAVLVPANAIGISTWDFFFFFLIYFWNKSRIGDAFVEALFWVPRLLLLWPCFTSEAGEFGPDPARS